MKTFTVILTLLAGITFVNAQDQYPAYEYGYDPFGNRIKRTYILWTPPDPTSLNENNGDMSMLQNIDNYNEENKVKDEDIDEGKEIIPISYNARINKRDITIHPNPTSGMLKLEIADISDINQSQILISDMTGKVLYSQEITSKQMDFDLGSQPSGAYIMAVRINGVSKEWKIIKME